jgi:hypothetical protein
MQELTSAAPNLGGGTTGHQPLTHLPRIVKDLSPPENSPEALDTAPNLSAYRVAPFCQGYESTCPSNCPLVTRSVVSVNLGSYLLTTDNWPLTTVL